MTIRLLDRHRISRDLILTFISRVGVTLAGGVSGILLARFLGVAEYGRFSFGYSALLFVVIFARLGLDGTAVRFVSEYIAKKEYGMLSTFLQKGRLWLLLSGVGSAILLCLIAALLSVSNKTFFMFLCAIPTLLLLVQVQFDQGVLNGFQKTAFSPLPEGCVRALVLLLLIVGWWWFAFAPLGAEIAFLFNGIGLFVALLLTRVYIKRLMGKHEIGSGPASLDNRRWLFTGMANLLIACSHVILSQTDIIMLGVFSDHITVGYYAVAVQVSVLLLFFGNAINPVITPRIALAYHRGDMKALVRDARLGTNLTFFLSLPLFIVLYIFRNEVVAFLFGSSYMTAGGVLGVLLFAQLAKVISAPIGFVMMMTEGEAIASYVIAGAATVNILFNLAFIPSYGAIGAAYATACSALLWNVILIVIVKKRFSVWLVPFVSFGKGKARDVS